MQISWFPGFVNFGGLEISVVCGNSDQPSLRPLAGRRMNGFFFLFVLGDNSLKEELLIDVTFEWPVNFYQII